MTGGVRQQKSNWEIPDKTDFPIPQARFFEQQKEKIV
jgi:hypothetical protein